MARRYANQFDAIMSGYNQGRQAVKDWQNDQIDTEAGQAFKDATQIKTQTESDFGAVDPNAVYSGAGADGAMTNAEAASYGVFAPEKETRKYGLGANPSAWTDKAATPQEQNIAGNRAMGAVYSGAGKHEIAMRYGTAADQSEANAQQRELTGMQINAAKRNDDYEKGKNNAFASTPWAKAMAEGRKPTTGEQLQSAAHLFAYDAQNGKATPQGMMEIAGKMQSHETENYTKAVQALHSGASKETIAKVFNASGMQIDPASISDPRPVEVDVGGGQKVKTFEITYTDPKGGVHTLNGRRELDALGKGAESFNQAVKLAELKNDTTKAGAAASSAASTAALHGAQTDEIKQKTADRKDLAVIHSALNAAIEAKDAAAEKTERAKLSAYVSAGRGSQSMSPEERKANFYLASGKAKTLEEAATMAHQKVQASAGDDFREFSKPNSSGMTPDKKQVEEFMTLQHGANWRGKLPGGNASAAPAKAGWGVTDITNGRPANPAAAGTQAPPQAVPVAAPVAAGIVSMEPAGTTLLGGKQFVVTYSDGSKKIVSGDDAERQNILMK